MGELPAIDEEHAADDETNSQRLMDSFADKLLDKLADKVIEMEQVQSLLFDSGEDLDSNAGFVQDSDALAEDDDWEDELELALGLRGGAKAMKAMAMKAMAMK